MVYSCSSVENRIALTFDDGPHPVLTPEILDILEGEGITATFFVVGENAELYPALIEREAEDGFEIGNHTYSHANLREEPYGEVCCQIDEGERVRLC